MGISFQYRRYESLGKQYTVTCGRNHLLAALLRDGYSEVDAEKIIDRGWAEAGSAGVSPVIRVPRPQTTTVETDREIITAFIAEHYIPRRDCSTLFAAFYEAFLAWLSPALRPNWSRKRVAQALNVTDHPSVAGNRNVRVVKDLAKRPA
ncbi:hypothetical protein [Lacipirellula parvula]|uniref:hypothetical protein n=1 Tax=Lacipirellula parvula TaxID=2650471 RepID=UPI001260C156|nr:hypothetical protein [Lacipirellula parvula]